MKIFKNNNIIMVKHQLASDEGENLKRIVMSSFWKKNTLCLILGFSF